jgi:hypothetical protein
LVGTSTITESALTSTSFFNPPFLPPPVVPATTSINNFANSSTAEQQITNDWTISVLARLGVLATQGSGPGGRRFIAPRPDGSEQEVIRTQAWIEGAG